MSLEAHFTYGSRELYLTALRDFITEGESNRSRIYIDSVGISTIGMV